MATTIDVKGSEYLLTFTAPETTWITDIAKSMGITKEAVVGAAMNKGLVYYVETFCPKSEPLGKQFDDETNGNVG